jgi:hypothetical protein
MMISVTVSGKSVRKIETSRRSVELLLVRWIFLTFTLSVAGGGKRGWR